MADGQPPRKRRWGRRPSTPAPLALGRVCPSCKQAGPALLRADEVCVTCAAQKAWADAASGGVVVIDHGDIATAVQRRTGATVRWWQRGLAWIPAALSIVAAIVTVVALADHAAPRALGPLHAVVGAMQAAARKAFWFGLGCLIVGIVALVRLRKRRQFRMLPFLVAHSLAVVVGASAAVIGGLHLAASRPYAGQHDTMPPRSAHSVSTHVDRIMAATVVVLAPDKNGDARNLAIGSGAIVGADASRAWIVTCSHVAMPYAAVGSWRDPADAHPVWVQLSDGRSGLAVVRWAAPPPIDVAVLELAVDSPPAPVTFAADPDLLEPGADVMFVPNPYRNGWLVHRGQLLRKEPHRSPAGTYSLLITDLPLIPGDSGSGLFDSRGQLVGLNTWVKIQDGAAHGISLPTHAMAVLADAIEHRQLDRLDALQPTAKDP